MARECYSRDVIFLINDYFLNTQQFKTITSFAFKWGGTSRADMPAKHFSE